MDPKTKMVIKRLGNTYKKKDEVLTKEEGGLRIATDAALDGYENDLGYVNRVIDFLIPTSPNGVFSELMDKRFALMQAGALDTGSELSCEIMEALNMAVKSYVKKKKEKEKARVKMNDYVRAYMSAHRVWDDEGRLDELIAILPGSYLRFNCFEMKEDLQLKKGKYADDQAED